MGYEQQESVTSNLVNQLNETKEKLAAKEAELIELKIKASYFLSETLAVGNAIQTIKNAYLDDDYEQAWQLVSAFRRSLRGDIGAGKDLKEAIK